MYQKSPKVIARQAIERRIVRAFVTKAIALGYTLLIDNGGDEDEHVKVTTVAEAMKEIMATDEDRIYVCEESTQKTIGWAFFVYGNDGWDVLNDYTCNLEEKWEIMDEVNKLIDKEADRA